MIARLPATAMRRAGSGSLQPQRLRRVADVATGLPRLTTQGVVRGNSVGSRFGAWANGGRHCASGPRLSLPDRDVSRDSFLDYGISESLVGAISPNRPVLGNDEPVKAQSHSGPVTHHAALGERLRGVRNAHTVFNGVICHPLNQLTKTSPEIRANCLRFALCLHQPPFCTLGVGTNKVSVTRGIHVESQVGEVFLKRTLYEALMGKLNP